MKQVHQLFRTILSEGTRQANRTGIDAISIPGYMMKFDLREGFPAVTTKKLFFEKGVVPELIGFIRGYDNAADFRALGCNIWNANANDPGKEGSPNKWVTNKNRKGEDDLGRIYGVQWRHWRGLVTKVTASPVSRDEKKMNFVAELEYAEVDQLQKCIDTIKNDPTNRRIIFSAWRPDEFDSMALPPCHVLYQFIVNVESNELNLCLYQRSCDSFLGVPFNIASASLLLSIVARITGYRPAIFTHFLADAHLYVNHLDQVDLMLSRECRPLPVLELKRHWTIDTIEPADIELSGYDPHPAIKAEMAV